MLWQVHAGSVTWPVLAAFLRWFAHLILALGGVHYPSRSCNGLNGPKGPKFKKTKQKQNKHI